MNNLPLVSIVTPSFNQAQFLEETIRSVLAQTYPAVEYWVIDGLSTDHSLDIIRKYEPFGVHWISEKDNGQSDALLKGFELSKGEIIGWVNSDDILLPDTVQKIVHAFAKEEDIGLVYGEIQYVDECGENIKVVRTGELTVDKLTRISQSVPQVGSFYRSKFFKQVGGIDTSLDFVMDYDLFLRLLRVSKGVYIPEVLAKFRMHSQSKSYNFSSSRSIIEAFKVGWRYDAPLFSILTYKRSLALAKALIKSMLRMPPTNIDRLRKSS